MQVQCGKEGEKGRIVGRRDAGFGKGEEVGKESQGRWGEVVDGEDCVSVLRFLDFELAFGR